MKTVALSDAWAGKADCESCAIRDSVLFVGLRQPQFEQIHNQIDQYVLPPHALLYRAGDDAERLFTIRHGLVKLVQYLPDGDQRIVRLLRATDVTGLEALLGQGYQHDAIVMTETEVCALPAQLVLRLAQDNPTLHQELMHRWQKALVNADAWITELATGSARQRVARLVLRLLSAGDCHGECELFSREDMGAMLGITTETASRVVAEFKRQGLLSEITPNKVRMDVERLRQVSEE